MKTKILIISTRNISKKKTIFEHAVRNCKTSNGLKEYLARFLNKRIEKLDITKGFDALNDEPEIVQEFLKTSNQSSMEANDIADINCHDNIATELSEEEINEITGKITAFLPGEEQDINTIAGDDDIKWLEEIRNRLLERIKITDDAEKKKDISEYLMEFNKKYKSAFIQSSESLEKGNLLTIDYFEASDIEKYLNCQAVNTDKDKLKILDRVSLFKISSTEVPDKEKYFVYAVWPLGDPDEDILENNVHKSSVWVDCLSKAVIDDCKVDHNETEIVLLLHDNDLKTTHKTPFKTIYANDNSYKEGVTRTLAVFQHSNYFFNKIATCSDNANAKDIVTYAHNIIISNLKFLYWKELSHILAFFQGGQDCKLLESKLQSFKDKFNIKEDAPEKFTQIKNLMADPDNQDLLYPAICEVNEMIKKLRIQNI